MTENLEGRISDNANETDDIAYPPTRAAVVYITRKIVIINICRHKLAMVGF